MPADNTPVRFTLTAMDEFPRHQTAASFDTVANESPHWSDGYYFTLGDAAGEVMFILGFRLYANNNVMDAFTLVSSGGRQHNMRYSRRLRPDWELACGPMSVEIVDGMHTQRIRAEENPYGISYDLTWRGDHHPYLEDYLVVYRDGRLLSERSNYDQTSEVTGWIEFGGRRVEVASPQWVGARDHSWGVGSVGGRKGPNAAPPVERDPPLGLRQWVLFRLPTRTVFYQFHRNAHGELTKWESAVLYPYGDDREPWRYLGINEDLTWIADGDGTPLRRLDRGTIELVRPDGGADRFAIDVVSDPCYCLGGGYWNGYDDHRGRGAYRGDFHHEGEVWDISHPTRIVDPKGVAEPRNEWAETWATFTNLDDPDETGQGHLECVVLGPYPGFED